MSPLDVGIDLVLSVVLIVGANQFYFFAQRHWIRPARRFVSPLDERIPYSYGPGRPKALSVPCIHGSSRPRCWNTPDSGFMCFVV